MAGALAFVLRELLAALIADPVVLVLVAPLEGLGFSCVFVGGVTVVAARAPAGLGGTAQGLFSASAGLATILGSLGGGAVAGALGIRGLFGVVAGVGLLGAVMLALALLRPRPRSDAARPVTTAARRRRTSRRAARRQSKRASSATSRTRSMNRYSHSSALISAILPASAGWVLTSRSWSSEATW